MNVEIVVQRRLSSIPRGIMWERGHQFSKDRKLHSLDIGRQIPLERTNTRRNRRKVRRANQEFVVVLEQEGPLRGI